MAFELDPYLADLRSQIDLSLAEILPDADGDDPLRLKAAMRDAVLGGGKRLRPCLTLAACQAVGGTIEQALRPACAVEMIHCYSLVHDDLPAMDDADTRRGQPSSHKRYGEAAAILVGDALLTHAFEVLVSPALQGNAPAGQALRASVELARAAGVPGMVGGQALDIALKDETPPFDVLERCHRAKTAALFCASTTIGALFGGGTDEQVARLNEYGLNVGLAFQHADDLRDHDFPQYRASSLSRCEELAGSAAALAGRFGAAGEPLAALADLVCERAREVT